MPSCDLITKAKRYDATHKRKIRRTAYNDEEVQLAAAWMEGEITTGAVAIVLGCHISDVGKRCSSAIRQAIAGGRIGFTWYQPDTY